MPAYDDVVIDRYMCMFFGYLDKKQSYLSLCYTSKGCQKYGRYLERSRERGSLIEIYELICGLSAKRRPDLRNKIQWGVCVILPKSTTKTDAGAGT